MERDSPEMDMYSRLLSHLQHSSKQKKPEIYEGFETDIAVLQSNNKDIMRLIETDLKSILPSMLLFSVNKDLSVRTAVVKCFDTFSGILNRKPMIKSEPWWKEVESSIMAQDFNTHLIKLVETTTDDTWPHIWAFVISLIVYDEQMHGTAINSLLKVVEIAFKLSRKHETILEKAYYCWNRLIDIFCVHPRIVTSQKLIELLVRPLSTNLSLKCPKLKLETWSNLVHKVGFICGNTKCKLVIEPFIDFAYLKDCDSLCLLYPVDCIKAFRDIVQEKKVYKYCVTKIMSALVPVFQSGSSENLNEYIIEIWTAVIDNVKELEKSNQNDYITDLVNKLPQVLQIERPKLNDVLIQVTLDKKVFSTENMKMFILAQVPVMPIISSLMKYNEFQRQFFPPIISDLLEHFLEAQNKKSQNNVELEIWDLVCEVFILWLKSLPLPQEPAAINAELLCSLLLIPLLSKQWSVPVQRTWNSVMEYTQIIVPSNNYLLLFIEKFNKELNESHISVDFAVEFCTFLSNKDKSVFKSLMSTFSLISKCLPNKDPKPLMDLLVLVENSIRFIPKQDLIKLLTELMSNSNSYGQPYDLRIKTKITKLQRKLFTLKDPNEGSKEQDGQLLKNQEKEQQNGQKTRSPLMAQSNFLHRLAKAEEKKIKKRASMSTIFCDIHSHEEAETSSPEKSDDNKLDGLDSPGIQLPIVSKDDKKESNKLDGKEADEKKISLMNGRSSPVIPSVVTVVTTPSRKRSAKQPEAILSQETNKRQVAKVLPPPLCYFEDDAQDYVIVPPKPKSTPLTEHQKEVLSKRRADIPALYQDLTQDTQSLSSQSIKEVATLKEIKLNDTAESSEVTAIKEDKEETNNTNLKLDEESKKKEQPEVLTIENRENIIADESQDIINDTQSQYDSGINLCLTPTKHAPVPTQKNLLSKFNLLECDETEDDKTVDEEEVEKENKIVNIEEMASHKSTIKRRSLRKSTNKYISKKPDELPKSKTKKEASESVSQSLELTPKGKIKKSSETIIKIVDDACTAKTKNNVMEILKKDVESDAKENQRNGISDGEEKSISNVECSLKNNISVETLNHLEKRKAVISDGLLEISMISSKGNKDIEHIVKLTNLNLPFISDILDSSSKITQENSVIIDKEFKDDSSKVVSDISLADTEEMTEFLLKTSSNIFEGIEDAEKSIDISKHSSNFASNNEGAVLLLNVSDNHSQSSCLALKEKTNDKILGSDYENISELTAIIVKEDCSRMGLNKGNDQIESSVVCATADNVTTEKELLAMCSIDTIKSHEPISVLNSINESCIESNSIKQEMNENKIESGTEVMIQVKENCEIGEVKIKIEDDENIDQNSSGDSNSANWSMVTPEKKGRKRKVSDVKVEKFSPKLLRSKRLSLSKQTPENSAEKNNKKTKTTPKNNSKGNKASISETASEDKKTHKKSLSSEAKSSVEAVAESADASFVRSSISENGIDSKPLSPKLEVCGVRKTNKRKSNDQIVTPPSQPKKPKSESNSEEANQDSLALLKNNAVKPRKKKVIKSNMKSSPNNLEQWLIKSGKAVVKTSLLSSNDKSSSPSESKIINANSEIQISSSEPKKIIVEMSPISRSSNSTSLVIEESVIEMEESPAKVMSPEDTKDCHENVPKVVIDPPAENDSAALNLSSDDEVIPSVLEPEEPAIVNEAEDIESIERQFLEAIKRGAEEEEDNMKRRQEERLRHLTIQQEEEEEEDEDSLVDSLKCDESELDRTSSELDKNSNASQVKLESMIYAKYRTTLRRPRRRKRLLRRVKKQDGENDLEEELEEEEETFEERRERLTTPFRPSGGRSAQMVKMATTEEDPPVTPVRGRRSITPIQLTENWPEGRCEQWVPYMPTPPGVSPSLGILKRKASPVPSPTSSPNTKKKRVSFLDPPVSKGLLYSKGSDNIGQVQHANIPPGKRPIWKGFECESEEKGPSSILKAQEVDGGFGPVEAEDELNAIQEFLNSTPDAPWKDTPLAGDICKIPGIISCGDPVQNIISRLASQGDEKKLTEELQRMKINTIGGFCSLTVSDIKKLSMRPAKVTTLYNVLKDYFQCQPSSSKKLQSAKLQDDALKSLDDCEKMDFVETQIEITTLGIEMGIQVDPSEICSDDTLALPQMSQKVLQNSQDYCLTPPVVKEPDMYSDSQEEIKIPSRDEIALMFQSDVFIKRAAPFATFSFISKLAAAAADYFGHRPD